MNNKLGILNIEPTFHNPKEIKVDNSNSIYCNINPNSIHRNIIANKDSS